MNEDGELQVTLFNPALTRLLGLARQVFCGCSAWLFLTEEGEKDSTVLLDENGLMTAVAGREDAATGRSLGRWDGRISSPVFSDLAVSRNRSLLGVVSVGDEENNHGALLLTAEMPRELSAAESDTLTDLARQVDLVLERDRLVVTVERARAAERVARESLAETRGDLRLVTDQVLEILCKTDLKGVIWSINPSAERDLGYQQGELVGRNVFDFIHPEERARAEEAFREAAAMGRFDAEIRCQHREGHFIHLVCSGAVLLDDNLMPNGLLLAGRNISRRKKAEADLRRLESRFKLVWENSRDAMRLIDEKGVIVQVNDAYCRLVDMPREELVGELFIVAYRYADPAQRMEEFREAFAKRTIPSRVEVELTLWNGSRRVFDRSTSFFEVEDQTLMLTIYRDITERREEEAELKRLNEALQQRAAHLGALTLKLTRVEQEERRRLAQILHDHLQQLLVAARMTMGRVRRRIPRGEPADAAAEVEHLLDESIEASRSITIELSPPVLHDAGLVPALEWLVRRVREKQGLQVHLAADPEAEPSSVPLRVLLFQAVRELLFNCYRHAEVTEVHLSVERIEGGTVQIVVRDEGAGFDSSCIELGAGSSRDCFGLFSLRERMEHLGGGMGIETAPGKGTRVTLVAPLEPDVNVPSSEEAQVDRNFAPEGPCGGKRDQLCGEKIALLLVDDHKILRQGLCELFQDEPDMRVVGEAENGLEGVRLAQELQPDVVIMDITMPVMNGIEATRVLAAELPWIKVIGLSMHMKEDMAQAMLEAGACSYVTKATASGTLAATIRECLKKTPAKAFGGRNKGTGAGSREVDGE